MKRTITTLTLCVLLAGVSQTIYAQKVKEKAQQEVDAAFDEASKQIDDDATEAKKEIDEASSEAVREINEVAVEAKGESGNGATINEAVNEMKESVREAVNEARQAVEEIRQEAHQAVNEGRQEARQAVDECKEEIGEENSQSGGAFTVQMLWFDTDPLMDLNRKESDLRGKRFDFDHRALPMIGGVGYYDVGGGTRIGIGASIGYKHYVSETFTTIDTIDGEIMSLDSAAVLRLWPAYVGFNFEKAFSMGNVTLFMGGLLGGGVNVLYKKFEDRTNPTAFITVRTDSTDDMDAKFGQIGISSFVAGDIHGGISFALAPVFSLGIEPYVLFTYAPEGFGTGFGDFFTTSPGLRFRFSFSKA